MTGAAAMTTFTPEAEARLEHYLIDVRAALANAPDVNPDEIEADIRTHIDVEFRASTRPVTAVELEAVLVRLGPPEVWAAAADGTPAARGVEPFDWSAFVMNMKRRVLSIPATLWRGPEDWRLPYIGFGLFALGMLTLPLFGFGLLLLGASYLFGRATAELAKEKGQPLGARRWLVYPGVIAFAAPVFLALSLWPLVAMPATAHEVSRAQLRVRYADEAKQGPIRMNTVIYSATPEQLAADRQLLAAIPATGDMAEGFAAVFAGIGALAGWWTILGLVMWAFPKWPTAIFHPLLDGYTDWHGVKLAATAGVAFFIWCGFAFRFAEKAGW